jgi:uncharacterized protein YeaO (DUF488 family)
MIRVQRVYDATDAKEGARFLVDRVWPRGVKKEALHLKAWERDVAPGDELRRWFGHDPDKWEEFQRRYFAELDAKREAWEPLLEAARRGDISLLYGARDTEHNQAVALKRYLEEHLQADQRSGR